MSVINSQPLIGASGNQGGAYNLTRSLRFRSSASANLSRTPASAGNRRTWTWSGWMKRGYLGSSTNAFFGAGTGATTEFVCYWNGDCISLGASNIGNTDTTAVFRDPASWYHVVIAFDTTQATANNRAKVYVNGVLFQWSSTLFVAQNTDYAINNNVIHRIGQRGDGTMSLDGYMTEVNFVDGQALDASSFGETSATTGVWIPKAYTGSYGTNGFYLDFEDTSSVAALGYDAAGSNDWTVNNISLTSGATYDSMTDVPTLTSATAANYCTLNPAIRPYPSADTIQNGNLQLYCNSAGVSGSAWGTQTLTSGKWYFESTIGAIGNNALVGFSNNTLAAGLGTYNADARSYGWFYQSNGQSWIANTGASYGATYTTGDVIGVALDLTNNEITFYKNNTSQGTLSGLSLTSGSAGWLPAVEGVNGTIHNANFGQRPFTYTPPTGFVALNTFNLPTPTIGATASSQANDYFDATTYTGNGSTQTITNAGGFQPDFVWIKNRTSALDHRLVDAVRGVTKEVYSNTTGTEGTDANGLTAFNSNGFSVGSSGSYNGNTNALVAWQWKANGAGSSNTAGTISSTVSANTTAGCSIVTYTGTGTTGATVGHGLGVAPNMIIIKSRGAVTSWPVYHSSLGATSWILLNSTSAATTSSQEFNNTAPTSTVFTIGSSSANSNQSATYVAYCFSEVAGYSKFGSYTGNGSTDGPFIYTGFRPKFIMWKRSDGVIDWGIIDSATSSYNFANNLLCPNGNFANQAYSDLGFDFVSNGFKVRGASGNTNASGGTYIYMAVAENPFKYANAR